MPAVGKDYLIFQLPLIEVRALGAISSIPPLFDVLGWGEVTSISQMPAFRFLRTRFAGVAKSPWDTTQNQTYFEKYFL